MAHYLLENFMKEIDDKKTREIIELLVESDLGGREIAEVLDLNVGTVRGYYTRIYEMYDVKGRMELFVKYISFLKNQHHELVDIYENEIRKIKLFGK